MFNAKRLVATAMAGAIAIGSAWAQPIPDGLHSALIEFHEAMHAGDAATLDMLIADDFEADIHGELLDRHGFLQRHHHDPHMPLSGVAFRLDDVTMTIEGDIATVTYVLTTIRIVADMTAGASRVALLHKAGPALVAQTEESGEIITTEEVLVVIRNTDGTMDFTFDGPTPSGYLVRLQLTVNCLEAC